MAVEVCIFALRLDYRESFRYNRTSDEWKQSSRNRIPNLNNKLSMYQLRQRVKAANKAKTENPDNEQLKVAA